MFTKIVTKLYRHTLKAASVYGKLAENKKMAAVSEFRSVNRELKFYRIFPKNSLNRGVMNPTLARAAIRMAYRRGMNASSKEQSLFLGEAFLIYKLLQQKVQWLGEFPTVVESDHVVNGMKIEAKSRFVTVTSDQRYRYQLSIRFTNLSSQVLRLISEHLYTKDETLKETTRECGISTLQRKVPSPLKNADAYEFATTLTLPTQLGSCQCHYLFANVQTGEIIRAPVPPLLLSTHDPDIAPRESRYRGDPYEDLEVVVQELSTPLSVQFQSERHPTDDTSEGKETMLLEADDETLESRQQGKGTERAPFQDFQHGDEEEMHPAQKAPQLG